MSYRRWTGWVRWALALCLAFSSALMAAEGARPGVGFNHDQTTFSLTGVHTNIACESCHTKGVFKGTPNTCTSCHNRGTTTIAQTTKPVGHMQTTRDCLVCHKTTGWIPALFDHKDPNLPACSTCHDGKTSTGKPAGHLATTKECGECHLTTAWVPAGMDHSTIVPPVAGRCSDCHGVTASGKPAKHVATGRQCDFCHTTTAWTPATYIHPEGVGNCQSCHNNVNAKGKSSRHISTTDDCNVCHTTNGWLPTSFAHTAQQLNGKTCADCHNGKAAVGKSAKHLPTTQTCDTCHTLAAWVPTSFAHTAQQFGGKTCADCHNGKTATGKNAKHLPTTQTCDTCHTLAAWVPTSFAHTAQQLSGKTCADCHNGKTATGKNAKHLPTTQTCDTCHNTTAWKPSQFAHQNVTIASNCTTCHNGKTATGRPTSGASAHKLAPMTSNTCGNCHTVGTAWAPTPMKHTGATNCTGCHVVSSVGNPWTPGKTNHISTAGSSQCSACHSTAVWKPANFSHKGITASSNCTVSCHNGTNATGRPTSGAKAHTIAPMIGTACGSCHTIGGVWTPASMKHTGATSCTSCHATAGNAWTSPAKPNHILTDGYAQCSSCHTTTGWLPTKFAHAGISTASNCATCHDGAKATGKPGIGTRAHLVAPMTNGTCGSCHTIGKAWLPAKMSHAGATGCSACHAISTSAGAWTPAKANHISTSGHAECTDCHTTTAWNPAKFSHQGVTSATDCTSCHNGTIETGRPASGLKVHSVAPMTGNNCGSCHKVGGAWVPGTMNHAGVTACRDCHAYTGNGWTITKANHIGTASQCSACHVTAAWKPASNFDHVASGVTSSSNCTGSGCHGMTTKAAPQGGMPTTGTRTHKLTMINASCGSCHNIGSVWTPATMSHSGATDCKACHSTPVANGFTPGKASHISTTAYPNCSTCHTISAWKPTSFAHQNVTSATDCTACHNGTKASGRPTAGAKAHTVVPMNAKTCGSCHTIGAGWVPGTMNHTGLTSCTSCHAISANGNGWTPGKTGHIPTTGYAQCSGCHSTTVWKPAAFTHSGVTSATDCTTCHNGTAATGRPINGAKAHSVAPMSTRKTCGSCHTIGGSWVVTPPMNHAGLTACTSCHAYTGNSWTPVKAGHLSTTAQCSSCHATAAWLPVARIDHSGFGAATDCTISGCHNGTAATGRPTGTKAHTATPMTSNACGACHTPGTVWAPATMNHAGATACRDCHAYTGNGWTVAKANHISTASQCSVCHVTTVWKPASNFDHGTAGISVASNCTGSGCHAMATKAAPQAGMPTTGTKAHKLSMVSANCGSCHSIGTVWTPGAMNHSGTTDCKACHSTPAANGFTPAKASHISTTAYPNCSSCHTSSAWKPTSFNHQNVTSVTNCTTCHNGAAATGRPTTGTKAHKVAPMSTSTTCGSCHTIGSSWVVTPPMNHAGLTSCTSCHAFAGNSWTPVKAGHISTTGYAQCSSCHSTTVWKPAAFSHSGITSATNCTTCHNGTAATGRPISGIKAHTVAPMSTSTTCGSCHTIGSSWVVTPPMNHAGLTSCTSCHAFAGNSWTPVKAGHISTTGYPQCSSCHSTIGWLPAAFAHTGVTSTTNCTTCHNGTAATGRPVSGTKAHTVAPMSTSTTCGSCHTIGSSWVVTPPMSHAGLTACISCHAYTGNNWTPSKAGHLSTAAQCSTCHATTAWLPATHIDHAGFGTSTNCTVSGCHNGTAATGRPTTGTKAHLVAPMTNTTCGTCHTPGTVWTPATMNHTGVTSCTSCHATPAGNGFTPAKANHISTAGHAQCTDCHSTVVWKPSTFAHQGISAATTCTTCHNGSNATGRPVSGAKAHSVAPMSTSTTCGSCHTVGGSWLVAPPMNHTGLTACASCHTYIGNGWTPAKAGHMVTTTPCSSCHMTTAWLPASAFNHAGNGITAASNCTTSGCHVTPGAGVPKAGRPVSGAKAHSVAPMSTSTACGSCHSVGTVWTPATMNHTGATSCTSCHATTGNGFTPAKANHMSTTGYAQCSACHTTTLWLPASFNHQGVSAVSDCYTGCHNGTAVATTRPVGVKAHTVAPMTGNACGSCHTIGTAWAPATMNHTGATTCTNCHPTTTASTWTTPGKTNHIPTTGYPQCSSCHLTSGWKPTSFSHTGVVAGSCANCHNGSGATGPTAIHPANSVGTGATYKCDACHRTTAWLPATFAHSGVTSGCADCHKTGFATPKSATHFITTQGCEKCHTTLTWAPIRSYVHVTANYKQHPSLSMTVYADCKLCHITNNEVISGAPSGGNASLKPDCAWCHASKFIASKHKHFSAPTTVYYTVSELRNCSGACHQTNQTTGAVTTRNGPQHKTSGW